MLYISVAAGLLLANGAWGMYLLFKSEKSFISLFYLLCVTILFAFGVSGYLSGINRNGFMLILNQHVALLLFSLIPFFFLHFVLLLTGFAGSGISRLITTLIYLTGLITYFLIQFKLIPAPVLSFDGQTSYGLIFFITWLSIFLSLGVSYGYTIFNALAEKKVKQDLLIAGLGILVIILPGPVSQAALHLIFGQSSDWYFLSSIFALVLSIYFVFRNKAILSLYDTLRLALESMNDMMLRVNGDFQIIFARGAFQKLSGFTENELTGLYLDQIIEQKETLKNYRLNVAEGKLKEANFDLTLIKKSRDTKYMNFSFTPLFSHGSLNGYVCMGRDISERRGIEEELRRGRESLELKIQKRTEELAKINEELQGDIIKRKQTESELIAAREKADEANRLKFSLLANLSHELRTPMIGIMGMAEILKGEARSFEHSEYAESIISSAQRLMTTLDKLMTLSQLESGSLELNNTRLNIAEAARDEMENFRQRADEKKIKLSFLVKNNADICINADERIFRHILANLLDNAVKFTGKGGVVVETDSLIEKGNLWAYLRVIDTGIGISQSSLEVIFEEFRQGSEGNQRSFEGNGLGLTLVKKMLLITKGAISVQSSEGKGSAFTVRWPGVLVNKDIPEAKVQQKAAEETGAGIEETEEKLKTILFVEENSIQAKLTGKFLEGAALVDFAEDGYSAIQKIKKNNYAAVFINTELSLGMSGVELMRDIRDFPRYSKIPLIAVTKDLGPLNKELILKGFSSFIIKPFEKGELVRFVTDVLK
jgi:PAS domain S-box-containing protein